MTDSEKLDLLLEQFKTMQGDISTMQGDISEMKRDIADNKSAIHTLQREVTDVRLTLENETNQNIMRIAKGHLNLSRRLDESLKIDSEKDMMIRLTIVENKVRRLEEKAEQTA